MASFNSPALDHAIADDIPALVELLRHLSAMDYTGSTDIPTGAIRWNKSNKLFENYDGTSWISLGKLGHDVETVDGHSAHTGTAAGTIPVRGADGAIPGSVTGNAVTATLAAGLSQILGVDKGGTGASTTAQARVNLGVGYGTAAGSVCQGNDVRLSDARTPLAHKASHKTGGTDAITPADIGAIAMSNASSAANANYVIQRDAAGRAKVAAPSASDDIARKAEVDAVMAARYELCEFYFFRHPTLRPGMQPAQGGLLANAATLYPQAWAYLQTTAGKKLCKTEAEWQALTKVTWATLADGTKVGWNGIGGAPFFAPNTATGALRLPDLRGMYAEAAGFDSLGVGGVHGDGIRNLSGYVGWSDNAGGLSTLFGTGAFKNGSTSAAGLTIDRSSFTYGAMIRELYYMVHIDPSLIVPTAAKNQPRAWGALACVYLGLSS